MTVVAWDGRYLAADMQATTGEAAISIIKIVKHEVPYPIAFAITGFIDIRDRFIEHYYDRTLPSPRDKENGGRLVIVKDKKLTWLEDGGMELETLDLYVAFGNGMDYALGAMHAGANAEGAVRAAIHHGVGCGCGISVYDSFTHDLRHEVFR